MEVMTDPIELDLEKEQPEKDEVDKGPEEDEGEKEEVDAKGEADAQGQEKDAQDEVEAKAEADAQDEVDIQGDADAGEQEEARCETRTIIREPEDPEEPIVGAQERERSDSVSPANVIISHIFWNFCTSFYSPLK